MTFFCSLLVFTLLFTTGCVSMNEIRAKESAGQIGCLPSEIEIAEDSDSVWSATCNGKKFICNSLTSGGSSVFGNTSQARVAPTRTVSCKEKLKQ